MKKYFLLRGYELRKKFRYLTRKQVYKNEIIRQFSSCVIEKFSGFDIVKKPYNDKLKNVCIPIDIVYFLEKNTTK